MKRKRQGKENGKDQQHFARSKALSKKNDVEWMNEN